MDMDGMDEGGMSMSGMDMGTGMPSLPYLQQMYWAVVGTVIGIAMVFNILNYVNYRLRISAASKGIATPAKPKTRFWRYYATLTAVSREVAYASLRPRRVKGFNLRFPRLGRTALILGYLVLILVLCFYGLQTNNYSDYEAIGYRTGFINICQLPLLFFLVGRNNIVSALTGFSFEKLNWIHRWVARCLLITVTIHLGYWFADWAPYDYIGTKIATDDITRYGMIAWALLLWIVFSSMTPIRGWCYEFFVIQHIISFSAFLGVVWMHVPAGSSGPRYWVYICIALVCLDRLARVLRVLWVNFSFFHPKQRRSASISSLLSCEAEFTPLAYETTRITIKNPPINWSPGQFVFLSCHSIIPLQSHPFTIASIPGDGQMDFLVKSNTGATRSFFRHATKNGQLPSLTTDINIAPDRITTIEGPYGSNRPLRQFDSVIFFAGSTGATFTMPLMRELVASWKNVRYAPKSQSGFLTSPEGSVTRRIRFVWVVKSKGQVEWFGSQLTQVICDVGELREMGADVSIDISIYVTCDDAFASEHANALKRHRNSRSADKHRFVEEISVSDEKTAAKLFEEVEQREVKSAGSDFSSEPDDQQDGCGSSGTCSCRATVDDEDKISPTVCICDVLQSQPTLVTTASSVASKTSSYSGRAEKKSLLVHPAISVLGGRPQPYTIIGKSLELALGESAVVVCGPKALVDDVRLSTVQLSDERAVHKGSGAQGICLITEYFGY